MSPTLVIARQELANGLRNRWVAGAVALMAVFSLSLALLGSAPVGVVGGGAFGVLLVSLASLSVFLVPLIALLLGHDAVAGEAERGTLPLLLAYPVARWQILAGKFVGHLAILLLAVGLGYAAALAALAAGGAGVAASEVAAFAVLVGTAVLMGAVFLALGYLASVLVRERATAVGIAIGLWLVFVVVYDLLLLGVLVAFEGRLPTALVSALVLVNPTDAFRLLNLAGSPAAALAAGMSAAGAKAGLGATALLGALLAWLVAALAAGWLAFSRKEP